MALTSGRQNLVAAVAAQLAASVASAANSVKNKASTASGGSTGSTGGSGGSTGSTNKGTVAMALNGIKTKVGDTSGTGSTGSSGGSTSTKNSQYTAIGSYNDAGVSDWAQKQIAYCKEQYTLAQESGNQALADEWHDKAEAIRANYGYSGGTDGSDLIVLPQEEFVYPEFEETYKSDPRIDELLNQILNRDEFSYDVESDPLYQQYVQMYNREGDRAMRETMAEAAAGAGMETKMPRQGGVAGGWYNSTCVGNEYGCNKGGF